MNRQTRFPPDPLDHTLIDFKDQANFQPTTVALILNESHGGSALVVQTSENLTKDQVMKVKVGNLHPMRARVVWAKLLDPTIWKIGIQFLE